MPHTFQVVSALIKTVALLAMLAVVVGMIERRFASPLTRSAIIAALFSLAALVTMATPLVLMDGLIVDGRSTIVGLGAAVGGPVAAVVVAATAAAYRYFSIGGIGAVPGSVDIILSALLGLLWGQFWLQRRRLTPANLLFGGVFLSSSVFAAVALLPPGPDMMLLRVTPMLMLTDISGALILGLLLKRERDLIAHERRLAIEADRDLLTGVANRNRLLRRIEDLERSPKAETCTILVFDIDHFKRVNDNHGHVSGDAVLSQFSGTLLSHARQQDLVVRMGGEEFLILLPGADTATGERLAARILHEVRTQVFSADGSKLRITASAGVSSFKAGAGAFRDAYKTADQRLHRAKQTGRDRVVGDDVPERVAS